MLKRFLNGQTVSALTKTGKPFNGYISTKDGEKIVVNESKKWVRLSNLDSVALTGKILHETLEDSVNSIVSNLDADKLQKASTSDKQKVKSAIIDSLGDDAKKNEDEVSACIDASLLKSQAEKGTSSDTKILQKFVDEKATEVNGNQSIMESTEVVDAIDFVEAPTLEAFDLSSVIDSSISDLESSILAEIEPYIDSKNREELISICLTAGIDASPEEIGNTIDLILSDDIQISSEDQLNIIYPQVVDNYDEYDYENALDAYYESTDKPTDEELYEFVCNKLNFSDNDRLTALEETEGNVIDAICKLAESRERLSEASVNTLISVLSKFLNGFNPAAKEKQGLVLSEKGFNTSLQSPTDIYDAIQRTIGQSENGKVVNGTQLINPNDAASLVINTIINSSFIRLNSNDIVKLSAYINKSPKKQNIIQILTNIKYALAIQLTRNGELQNAMRVGNESLSQTYGKLFGKAI